jgi:hypothetical protein
MYLGRCPVCYKEEKMIIEFGALASPLYKQYGGSEKKFRLFQRMADAILLLSIRGIMTESEEHKAHEKLIRKIAASIKE